MTKPDCRADWRQRAGGECGDVLLVGHRRQEAEHILEIAGRRKVRKEFPLDFSNIRALSPFDSEGRKTRISVPQGTLPRQTDPMNRIRKLWTRGFVALFSLVAVLTSLTVADASARVLASYTYTLNASGQRTQVVEKTGRTTSYAYDGLDRLASETLADPGDSAQNGAISYTLDKVGNRLSRISFVPSVSSSANSFNSRDWLSGDTYDTNGNTLTSPLTIYGLPLTVPDVYDFEDRLIVRYRPDGSSVNLGYDADGVRVQKTVLDLSATLVSATGYLVDTNNLTGYAQVVEEYRNAGAVSTVTVYTYGSNLISQSVSLNSQVSTVSYFATDGLGSVRQLTNASGDPTDTWDYDAFGNLTRRAGASDNPYLYRGEQFDADLGMYYLRARLYNQSTGRFWTMDSYEGSGTDPASLHKYLYANANPVMGFDPSGHLFLANFYYGNLVHDLIGEDFTSRGYGFSNARIDTFVGPSMFGALRPDLTTPATPFSPGEVYEIKSVVTGPIAASAQLTFYASSRISVGRDRAFRGEIGWRRENWRSCGSRVQGF